MKRQIKILFICKRRHDSYGISVGLINSASFVANMLQRLGFKAKVIVVTDANGVDREIYKYSPTHVVLEALWIPPAKMFELVRIYKRRIPHLEWIVRIHSKAPFLAHEGVALDWVTAYQQTIMKVYNNFHISTNNLSFNKDLNGSLHVRSIYLPNVYEPDIYPISPVPLKKIEKGKNIVNIGCFGAIRPLKNHLLQAMSAIRFGNQNRKIIHFHVNAGRLEQSGENVLKNLRALFRYQHHKLIEHGWMKHSEFINLVKQMDIGMQVSLSESFNIVAADMVANGVPVVVSEEIDWVPFIFQADSKSGDDIVSVLNLAYYGKIVHFEYINKIALWLSNLRNSKVWIRFLRPDR